MKLMLPLVTVPFALLVGGVYVAVRSESLDTLDAAELDLAPDSTYSSPLAIAFDDLLAEFQTMQQRVDHLEMELGILRRARDLEVVAAEVEVPKSVATGVVPPPTRAAIESVINDIRRQEREARRIEREQRVMEQTLERASAIAKKVGLGPDDEKKIVDILIGQRQRGEEWKASLEGLDREARREMSYQAMKEIRDWRSQEIQTHFDANVVQQLVRMIEPKQARKDLEKADRSDKIQRRKQKKNDGRKRD